MKSKYNHRVGVLFLLFFLISFGCSRDNALIPATYPQDPDIFSDDFVSGLNYDAFGDSKVTAFEVDEDVTYEGTSSMRFDVPNEGDSEGGYAGGVFSTDIGRDLSSFDALTFWIKGSQSATIDLLGFGNDLLTSTYQASISDLLVDTKWTKVVIPIPDPAKLLTEKGMFFYADAPDDGEGYTFWVDELKFETLGTIAHASSSIQDGVDTSTQLVSGVATQISGVSSVFNMPNGTNREVTLSSSYFTYTSSDTAVAVVSSAGEVTVLSSGTTIITAMLAETESNGSLTIEASGTLISAPDPTVDSEEVISLFSNSYTNVTVDTFNPFWEFSTTQISEFAVDGNDVKFYTDLNFVGIVFSSSLVDASEMTHLHIDVFTSDSSEPLEFTVELVDFGDDGVFGGDDDGSISSTTTLTSGEWQGVEMELSGLSSRANAAQIVLSANTNLNNLFIDNLYFYDSGLETTPTGPESAATTPSEREASDVVSVFSDTYTNLEGTDYPDWGQTTVLTTEQIDGNNTLKFAGFNYQGTEFASSQDLSEMEYLHIDFWTTDASTFNVYLISSGGVETSYALSVPTEGWSSVEIPLTEFSSVVDLSDVIQMKYDEGGVGDSPDIYLDNVYFYKEAVSSTEPSTAAPTPSDREATNVISIFSDAYTNLEGTDYPDWGQTTVLTTEQIEENSTLKFAGFNYQGTQFASSQDLSEMEYLHIDFWTTNASTFNVYLISSGGVETSYALSVPTEGWSSVEIPLTEFSSVVDLTDVIQMKYDEGGVGDSPDIYLDNIYFYKVADEPSSAAPIPPERETSKVLSVFSDAYTSLEGIDYPNWGQATVLTTEQIEENNTLKFAGFNYQGTQFASAQDLSGMEYLHIDYWTSNASMFNVYLISPDSESDDDTTPEEIAYSLEVPTYGAWVSIDIPLTEFSSVVDLTDVIQMKYDEANVGDSPDIFLDNIYFY